MIRVNVDDVDLERVEIAEKGGNPTNDPRLGNTKSVTGIVFHSKDGQSVTLWSEHDLRPMLLRALQRLEPYYSKRATGLPPKPCKGG